MAGLTVTKKSIGASIEISNLQLSFKPGDSISGVVKHVRIEDGPDVMTCGISLVCQVKTRVSESNTADGRQNGASDSSRHYGEKVLLALGQTIYSGHVSKGINSWPFMIPLPQQQHLPPTYFTQSEYIQGATRDWLFVEYFVRAEVTKSSSPRHPVVALVPIYIRLPSSQREITTFDVRPWTASESLRTLRLNPELKDKRLSFRQHLQTALNPSSIPLFSFSLIVHYPSLLQLGHLSPVPLSVSAVPTRNDNIDSSDGGILPVLKLIKIETWLQSSTRSSELGGSSRKVVGRQDSYWRDTNLFTWSPKAPYAIPMGTHGEALDVGSIIQLRLSHRGVSVAGQPLVVFEEPLWPSFNSYHVAVSHQLSWRLTMECAGKTIKVKGLAAVMLLGPSEDWFQNTEAATTDVASEAYRQWNEGLEVAHGMAIVGGPPIWAAGERASSKRSNDKVWSDGLQGTEI